MRPEIMGDAARSGAYLEHAQRARPVIELQQTLDLHGLPLPGSQIENRVPQQPPASGAATAHPTGRGAGRGGFGGPIELSPDEKVELEAGNAGNQRGSRRCLGIFSVPRCAGSFGRNQFAVASVWHRESASGNDRVVRGNHDPA